MPGIYNPDNFAGRVNYVVAVISRKGGQTRLFSGRFEMNDATELAVAVYRHSLRNPKLAVNIWAYIAKDVVMGDVEALKDVKTSDLPARATQSRSCAKAATEKILEEHRRKQALPKSRPAASAMLISPMLFISPDPAWPAPRRDRGPAEPDPELFPERTNHDQATPPDRTRARCRSSLRPEARTLLEIQSAH